METEPIPQEEENEPDKLPVAEAFFVGGREEAVECPYCGKLEHAPRVGEPGGIKECEYMADSEERKRYRVVKRAA